MLNDLADVAETETVASVRTPRNCDPDKESLLDHAPAQAELSVRAELGAMLWLAAPISLATAARVAHSTVDVAFIGHIGTEELAASGYALTFYRGVSSIPQGFTVASIALCGQAFGAGNFQMVGVWTQISGVLGLFVSLVCASSIVAATEPLCRLISHEHSERVPRLAFEYVRIFAWNSPLFIFFQAVRFFFQAQGVILPATVVTWLALGADVGMNALFIHGAGGWDGMGFQGSPAASAGSMVLQIVLFLPVVCWWRRAGNTQCWPGWFKNVFTADRLRTMTSQGLYRALTMQTQQWSLTVVSCLVARLGNTEVAAHSVLLNLQLVLWALTWGWGLAVSKRGAEALGRAQPEGLFLCVKVNFIATVSFCALGGLLLVALKDDVARIFTSDEAVISLFGDSAPMLAAFFCSDSAGQVLGSALDACCLVRQRALVATASAWLLGVPVALVLGLATSMGLQGFWTGLAIGWGCRFIGFAVLLYRADMDAVVADAQRRAEVAKS
eukprot:TRINITY_DN55306_c0_g1_i1.p1 TRINITY_DN55306_c0_g1~~TRINITY_DN55306_c0_g1_i1.p1  ORF type:complete len:500 (+),score=113.89 TRINITY_DN55306_c0_g1_i1:133-1632(+)